MFGEWNRAYGSNGFLQYQFVVPPERSRSSRTSSSTSRQSGHYSFLNVFKLFGEGNQAPLSFPIPGWNICVDFPIAPGLDAFVDRTRRAGARSSAAGSTPPRTRGPRPRRSIAMYPRIDEWIKTRRVTYDPTGVFTSDMARRLELS